VHQSVIRTSKATALGDTLPEATGKTPNIILREFHRKPEQIDIDLSFAREARR